MKFELLALYPPGWGGVLLQGLLMTLLVAITAYIIGLLLGICGAMGKLYGGPIIRSILDGYTTVVRAVPELVLIAMAYYAGPAAVNALLAQLGLPPVDISGFTAGATVLGFVQGAYSTEVLRGAIQAIPAGQIEAAKAFGMSGWQRFHRVVLPAMIPFAIPGLANLWLIVTKETALLAVVGFSELALSMRQAAGTTKQYMMFFLAGAMLYLMLTLVSNFLFRRLEQHYRRGQRALG